MFLILFTFDEGIYCSAETFNPNIANLLIYSTLFLSIPLDVV